MRIGDLVYWASGTSICAGYIQDVVQVNITSEITARKYVVFDAFEPISEYVMHPVELCLSIDELLEELHQDAKLMKKEMARMSSLESRPHLRLC